MSLKIVAISFDNKLFNLASALKTFNLEHELKLHMIYFTDTTHVFSATDECDLSRYLPWETITSTELLQEADYCKILLEHHVTLSLPVCQGVTFHLRTGSIGTKFWETQAKYCLSK